MKILITDLQFRKSFDIYNICESKGYDILGLYSGGTFEKMFLPLIYLKKLYYLNKEGNISKVLLKIINQNNQEKVVYFPVEEDTTNSFYNLIEQKKIDNLYYNLPPKESFDTVKDKKKFSKFCMENKLPIPREYHYEMLIQQEKIPCNLIIKPKIGSGSVGIKFIDTYKELEALQSLDFDSYLIQERLANSQEIKGAFFLFNKGKCISYYGHERIRSYPPQGGVTVYSRCVLNDRLKVAGIELLEKLNWSGIAMVEFLYDQKRDEYKIIEVNPRAWGSIMLSEFCGANLITDYIKTSIDEEIIKSDIIENCYIRWFFPWDFLTYIKSKGKIKKFWNFETLNTCYINFSYSTWYRSLTYTLYNIFDVKKIMKLYRKIFSK